MCVHTSLTKSAKAIEKKTQKEFTTHKLYAPYFHFNGWETKNLAITTQEAPTQIALAKWGVLPTNYDINYRTHFLAKTNTLNATKERLFESDLYSQFIEGQRCIIYADGFFEPHAAAGVAKKIPYFFKEKNHELFAFAGIYAKVKQDQETGYAASIITTEANDFFKAIHNKPNASGSYRMPLILDPTHYEAWLQTNTTEEVKDLLNGFTQQELVSYPVSTNVFSSKKDSNVPNILDNVPFAQQLNFGDGLFS
jgi:putative SOS response-associated peptidase YedK